MLVVQSYTKDSDYIFTQITKTCFLIYLLSSLPIKLPRFGFIYLGFEIYIGRDFCLQPSAMEVNDFFPLVLTAVMINKGFNNISVRTECP